MSVSSSRCIVDVELCFNIEFKRYLHGSTSAGFGFTQIAYTLLRLSFRGYLQRTGIRLFRFRVLRRKHCPKSRFCLSRYVCMKYD